MKLITPFFPFVASVQIAAFFAYGFGAMLFVTILWFLFFFGLEKFIELKIQENKESSEEITVSTTEKTSVV